MRIGIGHIHGLGQACSGPLDPLCGEADPSTSGDFFNPQDPSYAAQSASSLTPAQASAAGAAPLTTSQLAFLTNPNPGVTTAPATTSSSSTGMLLAIGAGILLIAMVAKK